MNVQHALDATHGRDHRLQLQPARQTFEQNVQRLLDDVPRSPDNQNADQNGEQWIDLLPAGIANDHGSDDDADRTHQIAKHVHKRAADIDIVMPRGAQAPHDAPVEHQARSGHGNHGGFMYGQRAQQALIALVENPYRQNDQRESVDKRRQNAGAMVPESLDLVGRLGLQIETEPRQ